MNGPYKIIHAQSTGKCREFESLSGMKAMRGEEKDQLTIADGAPTVVPPHACV